AASSIGRYRVLSSTRVAARSRNSVEVSRSGGSAPAAMAAFHSARKASTSDPRHSPNTSSSWRETSWVSSSRSPSKTGVWTSYGIAGEGYSGTGAERDDRAGRLLAVNLARPIVAAAAAGVWLSPVAEAGLDVETGHG